MDSDDFLYVFLLLLSTALGCFVRKLDKADDRKVLCTFLGFVLLLIVSGKHILHPLIITGVNAAIILHLSKKYCHWFSFVFCFTYLIFLRTCHNFGVSQPSEIASTAVMIMVLKMVGLAYEMKSYSKLPSEGEKDYLVEEFSRIQPSFTDIFQYAFCYAGIFVGPYYKYRTYQDMFDKPYSMIVPHETFLKKRIKVLPMYVGLYILSDYFFPLSLASSEEIWQFSLLHRLFYVWPWFFSFRMRIYIAFVLGECICINLGLGAYPEACKSQPGAGPTNLALLQKMEQNSKDLKEVPCDFVTVRSMDEMASEFKPTMRDGIRYWNMTVQYWLAVYIYKNTSASKPLKMVATMFVSAVWHGIRPGYYLSLLIGTPLILISEREVERAFRPRPSGTAQKAYDIVWYFVKMQSVSYMGIAFILVDTSAILHYWSSVFYFGHVLAIVMFFIAFCKNKIFGAQKLSKAGLKVS